MTHVTEMKLRRDLAGLKVLAAILNFDWESGDSKQLEKLKPDLDAVDWIVFVEPLLKDRDKAKAAQDELKTVLLPIFAPEENVKPEEAILRIWKLIDKLNEVESKTKWMIEPVDFEPIYPTEDPEEEITEFGMRPLSPDEVKSKLKNLYIHPTEELNLLGYRWQFGRNMLQVSIGIDEEAPTMMYQFILDAFESGAIARFRRCLHCKAFFVAEDARQQFCSDEHRNEFNNKQRLESGYFKKRRGKKRKEDLTHARKLMREGKSPAQIVKETKLSLRVLKRAGVIQ
jgi:hypothetical protein